MRQRLIALLAGLAVFACAAAPASAGPYMSWGQWTSDQGTPFSQCWNRTPQALGAAGLSSSQDGRFFYGSNDVFTVSVICYDLGNRFIVTIVVSAERSGVSSMTTDQVRDRIQGVIFGSAGASVPRTNPADASGTWNWSATCNSGSNYSGTFTISNLQPDGTFNGAFTQNGYSEYNGTIDGQLRSGAVTFTRHFSSGEQQWNGTLDQTGSTMTGNFTGPCGPGTFTATKQ